MKKIKKDSKKSITIIESKRGSQREGERKLQKKEAKINDLIENKKLHNSRKNLHSTDLEKKYHTLQKESNKNAPKALDKIKFFALKKEISPQQIEKALIEINEISNIQNEKKLIEKINTIKNTKSEINKDLIIKLLNSLIFSFDEEFEKKSYQEIIFKIIEEEAKSLPQDIIKNILETRCQNIILLFKEGPASSEGKKVKKDIQIGF